MTTSPSLDNYHLRHGGGQDRARISVVPRAVVSTISSDAHTWNLVYLQLLLEEHGFAVCNLGACVPVDALINGCLVERPDLLVVSTVNGHGLIEAPQLIRAVRSRIELCDLVTVLGGKLTTGPMLADREVTTLMHQGFDGVFAGADPVAEFRTFLRSFVRHLHEVAAD